uniref:Biogenesis of lysosome-related organelles complex 1 subunit 1 n=1 Tax=Oryctolagus cuniculus TaxID=9986 RepID=A0A5F9DMX2_RABIT
MLSRLLKEHQAKQNERKELQEKRRREAITAATCLTEALVDHLNVGVAQAYVNQRKLDREVKTLQAQAAQFAKQTGQWIGMVENFNQALKTHSVPGPLLWLGASPRAQGLSQASTKQCHESGPGARLILGGTAGPRRGRNDRSKATSREGQLLSLTAPSWETTTQVATYPG